MAKKEIDKLMDHDADGIQEYDNDLPRWWLYGFYLTIVMSAVYLFYYEIYDGPDWDVLWYTERTQELEYEAEMAEAAISIANAPVGPAIDMILLTDAPSIEKGKEIFNSTDNLCTTCHREDLGGVIGPNLTDEYWMHGCSVQEMADNIVTGFPDKGMVPYGSSKKLSQLELLQVVSYIISMKGTDPPEPKPIEEDREVICAVEGDSPVL